MAGWAWGAVIAWALVVTLHRSDSAAAGPSASARVWRGTAGEDRILTFPELVPATGGNAALRELQSKPNNGVAFSGGGTRSFSVSIGYFLGLHELDLLKSTRYISSVSGGTWAAAAYIYTNPSTGAHVAQNDTALLGVVLPPHALNWAALDDVPPSSARHCATVGVGATPLTGAQYVTKIQDSFLTPLGVAPGSSFSYDPQTAADILRRNTHLSPSSLALPRRRAWGAPPFLIMGITLMGPLSSAPLSLSHRTYTVFDATPLYVGQARAQPVIFESRSQQIPNSTLHVGGLTETFAVGGNAPSVGLNRSLNEGVLAVPRPPHPFSLATAAAASSFFPGDVEGWLSKTIAEELGFKLPLWPSAEASPHATDMLIGDGGLAENTDLSSLLRRGVERIVLMLNSDTPLNPHWNASARPPTSKDVDDELAAFFGTSYYHAG
jgi:hypothetical protein